MIPALMLDTNAVSAVAKGRADVLVAMFDEHAFWISAITEAELRFGLVRRPVNAGLRRIVEAFLRTVGIRAWTSECAEHYARMRAELEANGKPLAPMDLMIAAHARAEACTLVTADRAFAQVPGLRVLDWSANGDPVVASEPEPQVHQEPLRMEIAVRDVHKAAGSAPSSVQKEVSKGKPRKKSGLTK